MARLFIVRSGIRPGVIRSLRHIMLAGILLCASNFVLGQKVFVGGSYSSGTGLRASIIWEVDLSDCSWEYVYIDSASYGWSDIALCPNGKLYGCGWGVDEIDLVNQTYTRLIDIPLGYTQEGIVCSCDTIIYGGSGKFFSYNINTGEFRDYGDLPGFLAILGDLYFYRGELYASMVGREIFRIDLDNIENSQIIHEPTSGSINGFHVVDNACVDTPFAFIGVLSLGDDRIVNVMNLETFEEQFHCTFNLGPKNRLNGWAGESVCVTETTCEIVIDLDGDDSAGWPALHFRDSTSCADSIPIADIDAVAHSDKPWDSLAVHLLDPVASAGILWCPAIPGIDVTGNGSGRLLITNAGDTPAADMAGLLRGVRLIPDPGLSDVGYTVACLAYARDLVSDTAFARLYVGDRPHPAGADIALVLCSRQGVFDLHQALPPDARPGGIWTGGIPADGLVDPGVTPAGTYHYIVTDSLCGPDSAAWHISIAPGPEIDLGRDTIVCARTTELLLQVPALWQYQWQDGSTDTIYAATTSGLYWVEATSPEGCTARDSIRIGFLPEALADTAFFLCAGDTLWFRGMMYAEPGMYDLHIPGAGEECDTVWQIRIAGVPDPERITTVGTLCAPGQVFLTAPDVPDGTYLWSTGETSARITITREGTYRVTVTYGDQCVLTDSVGIAACEAPAYYFPNIFSPNGDQINDEAILEGRDIRMATLEIYDRWGDLLYRERSARPGWNGRMHGQPMMPGTYVYVLDIEFDSGHTVRTAGSVALMR